MDEQTEEYAVNNWDRLPRDLKLLLLNRMEPGARANFCQANKRISDFCRQHKLTVDDRLIEEMNPDGLLIDTRRKQAELLKKGFQTVYSLVLTVDNIHEDGLHSNIPVLEEINATELVFGLNRGTHYFTRQGYDEHGFFVHLAYPGLPPRPGTLIKFVIEMFSAIDGNLVIDCTPVDGLSDIKRVIDDHLEDATDTDRAERLQELLDEGTVGVPSGQLRYVELPSP